MKNNVYEKPKMKFVNVCNQENIANVCWGGVSESIENPAECKGQNLTWAYYGKDHVLEPGEGYCTFVIHASNCKEATAKNVIFTFHGAANDGINDEYDQGLIKESFLEEVNVSNAGSNWSGEGTITPIVKS